MIIRSSREYHVIVIFLLMIIIISTLLLLDAGGDMLVITTVALLLFVLTIRFWIAVGRTLVFDSDGCTIKFMGIGRKYKWEDLTTRRLVDMANAIGYRQPYKGGVVFSIHKTTIPKKMKPADYCVLFHPFNFIFIYFDPKTEYKKGNIRIPGIYLVDEETFRKRLVEWNVEL